MGCGREVKDSQDMFSRSFNTLIKTKNYYILHLQQDNKMLIGECILGQMVLWKDSNPSLEGLII